jgi:hypothetical protein
MLLTTAGVKLLKTALPVIVVGGGGGRERCFLSFVHTREKEKEKDIPKKTTATTE